MVKVVNRHHWVSAKQRRFLVSLQRQTGHEMYWRPRAEGGVTKLMAHRMIRDLLARINGDNPEAIDDGLHRFDCAGCHLDRI